jgi:hypothetical protein
MHCVILETLYETVRLVQTCTPGTTKMNTWDHKNEHLGPQK